MWQNYTNAVLGLVIIGVAVFAGFTTTLAWTLGILGAVIMIVGFWGGAAEPEGTVGHA